MGGIESVGGGTEGDSGALPYQRTPPTEVLINGKRCVNTDADAILALRDHYRDCKVK